MKKLFLLPLIALCMIFASCSSDDIVVRPSVANANVVFSIQDDGTRAASVGDNWPSTTVHNNASSVVGAVYSTPLSAGLSFFTTNYSVNLTNDKGGSITSWNGSTGISLTEVNTITVDLTENTEGAFPKFKQAKGTVDLSGVDIDVEGTIDASKAVCTGDIKVTGISVTNGVVNVTISVSLSYDSYLLVAPSADWSVLTNVKGFKTLYWGGSKGTAFNTYTLSGSKWYYYWGHGNDYVYGTGTILSYGFNLYTTGTTPILVQNGYWYCLFASLNSAGEGDDNPDSSSTDDDKDKTHTVGGANGITPTSDDVVSGGAIR